MCPNPKATQCLHTSLFLWNDRKVLFSFQHGGKNLQNLRGYHKTLLLSSRKHQLFSESPPYVEKIFVVLLPNEKAYSPSSVPLSSLTENIAGRVTYYIPGFYKKFHWNYYISLKYINCIRPIFSKTKNVLSENLQPELLISFLSSFKSLAVMKMIIFEHSKNIQSITTDLCLNLFLETKFSLCVQYIILMV